MFHVVGYVCGFTIASDEVPLDKFFTICLFISPDFDGYRAPKGINPTRTVLPILNNEFQSKYCFAVMKPKRSESATRASLAEDWEW